MDPIRYALLAMAFYAAFNVILERKLTEISPLASTSCIYIGLFVVSMPLISLRNKLNMNLSMPTMSQFWPLVLCGILLFFADLSYFNAYKMGGKVEQIAVTSAIYPLFVSGMKIASNGDIPSRSDLLSWTLAGIAVVITCRQSLN